MGIQTSSDAVAQAPTIVDALRRADELAFEAGREPGLRSLRHLIAALSSGDDVVTIAAVHALAEMPDEQASRVLVSLLSDRRAFVREHAAWALVQTLPRTDAMGRLIAMVIAGGFSGMLAQRTLETWSVSAGELLAVALEAALLSASEPGPRSRLVETLGLVRQSIATRPLLAVATDTAEPAIVREAAIAALGQRGPADGVETALESIVAEGDRIGALARLSLIDLDATRVPDRDASGAPLTIAQLFLHADLDPQLSAAGAGDNGGIATLLVRLGDALVTESSHAVTRTVTLARGSVEDAAADLLDVSTRAAGHVFGRVPLAAEPVPSSAAWPLRVTARRGIRRALRAAGRIDVLHLRMADVGSLAAADVARELGIPTVFTLAPDPHSVITSLENAGQLSRQNFGDADLREHYWFRARLVQSLAASSEHTVLFPRPTLVDDMKRLVGVDIETHAERHTVVAEGVDIGVVDTAVDAMAAHLHRGADAPAELDGLVSLLASLPEQRRGLPLLVSVGRLHRVKGMASLVSAWAGSPLADRANLLIIGGDLQHPSADEQEQIGLIDAEVPPTDRLARGLLLPGHQANATAATWLAAARFGVPGLAAPGGVYVCSSLKEEFGIALLEAMATGLVVVAPDAGGPATYVEHGDTGFLVATWDRARMVGAIDAALERAATGGPEVAERAHAMVSDRFTIQGMAATLAPVYAGVAARDAHLQQLAVLPS
ncbi:glycosyltransferase [Microbacterium sp. cx-55]|uniref:glycosyltransferase n=1 Tax=unclassified Microbacterium TaxID=2609290 RepID=UPI001CBA8F69|nr:MULTISPECIES: glycosyltransferase [unclassified Microbacterium]MBZ4487513.1 glycosyltransferase [Microbacterium sp. cx-55]MCC4908349.1 glycosyltransferase [Microbacterium sp. cx-59]UGB35533.1 glycosyltransferase [Microbacterium sp. cx-55]